MISSVFATSGWSLLASTKSGVQPFWATPEMPKQLAKAFTAAGIALVGIALVAAALADVLLLESSLLGAMFHSLLDGFIDRLVSVAEFPGDCSQKSPC